MVSFIFSKIENNQQEDTSTVVDTYEEALTKANLDFTKQYNRTFCLTHCPFPISLRVIVSLFPLPPYHKSSV